MASVATQNPVDVPSSERVEPGSFPLAIAKFPENASSASTDPEKVATQWVDSFNKAISSPDLAKLSTLFLPESYWRDQLCLSWDFHTLKGPENIISAFKSSNGCRIKSLALDKSSSLRSSTASVIDADGKVHTVQAFVTIESNVGRGAGIVRLVKDQNAWKVFTLFTFLKELKGFEESVGKKRPNGVEHGEHTSRLNWLDLRKAEENFEGGKEPTVLILGAGQAGLSVAARLKMLGVKSLIVDREDRIGDNWRTRYHQLVLHDPVWFDHLPYLPFPESWPIFTPKDKLGDWFESYVKLLDLNAWTRTKITKSSWDDVSGKWTITLDRVVDGETKTRILHPKHVIQATGHSGEANFPSHIKGIGTFKGDRLVHSSKFTGAIPSEGKNKKAVIVGCCNSGHDIAQDFYEHGYSVTMVQRSSTFVVTAETNLNWLLSLYGPDSPPLEDADMIFMSMPNPVVKRMNIDGTKAQNKRDEKILQGLEKAGFKLDKGPDESGLWIKYLQRGGGYYIDVGCSQLIADGKIKIKQGHEITEVLPNGIKFDDDEILEADEVVFATGYLNMRTQCRQIFGDEIANRVKDVWGFDEEGEVRTMWRKSGHPGFWFMGGNLALCRWYSRQLALQIKGLEEGLCKYEDF
ncbi:hypothetical protein G7Y89_g3975 [Cudoniella acicularis]|uniref:Flavin-containing monooxygenase n=1 Tax=Cudoniella acicularis TaxID=354080 RepID=A0A8H4W7V8_9HELO|nr:hypothetical protein G7Y89_g3975 [Cudoniella acicularis]